MFLQKECPDTLSLNLLRLQSQLLSFLILSPGIKSFLTQNHHQWLSRAQENASYLSKLPCIDVATFQTKDLRLQLILLPGKYSNMHFMIESVPYARSGTKIASSRTPMISQNFGENTTTLARLITRVVRKLWKPQLHRRFGTGP